jgi:hypothetical protein
VSAEKEPEDAGRSVSKPDDESAPREIAEEENLSAFPVIHLGWDGEEVWENGEPVKREEEEYDLYKLDRLLKQWEHTPLLASYAQFIQPVDEQASTIRRENFTSRFKDFLRELSQPAPSPEIIEGLFRLAILVEKEIVAWENTVRMIKSDEFSNSLNCLQAEVTRFERIRNELGPRQKLPSWMSAWERLWIEAFGELQEDIEAQLRGAKSSLEALSILAKLGRTEVESLALLRHRNSIQESFRRTPLAKASNITLAAFAYGARLVRSTDDLNDPKGKYVNLIKARIARAEHSKAHMTVLATLLQGKLLSIIKKRPSAQPQPRASESSER